MENQAPTISGLARTVMGGGGLEMLTFQLYGVQILDTVSSKPHEYTVNTFSTYTCMYSN